MISTAENANKFQKTRFWKEKSVEDVVTLGPMAQATLVSIEDIIYFWSITLMAPHHRTLFFEQRLKLKVV